jgi:hypothetical protein
MTAPQPNADGSIRMVNTLPARRFSGEMTTPKSQTPLWLQLVAVPCLVFTILSLISVAIAHSWLWWVTWDHFQNPAHRDGLGLALIWFFYTFYGASVSVILCLASIVTAIVARLRFRWAGYLIPLAIVFFLWFVAFIIWVIVWTKSHGPPEKPVKVAVSTENAHKCPRVLVEPPLPYCMTLENTCPKMSARIAEHTGLTPRDI